MLLEEGKEGWRLVVGAGKLFPANEKEEVDTQWCCGWYKITFLLYIFQKYIS